MKDICEYVVQDHAIKVGGGSHSLTGVEGVSRRAKSAHVILEQSLNPIPYGLFNKPNLMGGQICPHPGYIAIGGYFH